MWVIIYVGMCDCVQIVVCIWYESHVCKCGVYVGNGVIDGPDSGYCIVGGRAACGETAVGGVGKCQGGNDCLARIRISYHDVIKGNTGSAFGIGLALIQIRGA